MENSKRKMNESLKKLSERLALIADNRLKTALEGVLANRTGFDPVNARDALQKAIIDARRQPNAKDLMRMLRRQHGLPDDEPPKPSRQMATKDPFKMALARWKNRSEHPNKVSRKEFLAACAAAYALADREDTDKLTARIAEAGNVESDSARAELLKKLADEMPALFERVQKETSKTDVFKTIIIASLLNGAINAMAGRSMLADDVEFASPVDWATAEKNERVQSFLAGFDEGEVATLKSDIEDRALALSAVDNARAAEEIGKVANGVAESLLEDSVLGIEQARARNLGLQVDKFKKARESKAVENPKVEAASEFATGFGFWKAGNMRVPLLMNPAQEFFRASPRHVWRDWPTRWDVAGGKFLEIGSSDYPAGRMVAPVNAGIWTAISAFGTPWAPFDYNSGMDLKYLSRAEAISLGVITPEYKPIQSSAKFNDGFKVAANLSVGMNEALKRVLDGRFKLNDDGTISNRKGHDEPPTDAQKEAGNYRKQHVKVHGLNISIENPKGSIRSGKAKDGTGWSTVMPAHYGYIRGTLGADATDESPDQVDCYIGDNPASSKVWVVDQIRKDGTFDEHKCILGCDDESQAIGKYITAFSDGFGQRRIGAVTEMDVDDFKDWLKDGDTSLPLANARGGDDEFLVNNANPNWDLQPRDDHGHWKDEGKGKGKTHGAYNPGMFSKPLVQLPKITKAAPTDVDEIEDALSASADKHWKDWSSPKEEKIHKGKWDSAGGVVVNEKGHVALVKTKDKYGGVDWTFPKGMIDKGETHEQAAHRELGEEAGIKGEIVGDLGTHEGTSSNTHYFLMHHVGDAPELLDGEMAETKWVHPNEAADLLDNKRDLRVLAKAMAAMHARSMLKNRGEDDILSNASAKQKAEQAAENAKYGLPEGHPLLAPITTKGGGSLNPYGNHAKHQAKIDAAAKAGDLKTLAHQATVGHTALRLKAYHAMNEIALKKYGVSPNKDAVGLPSDHPYLTPINPFKATNNIAALTAVK